MENKDSNIVDITSRDGFVASSDVLDEGEILEKKTKVTNPIAKNFTKFVLRSKDRFGIKDIFR